MLQGSQADQLKLADGTLLLKINNININIKYVCMHIQKRLAINVAMHQPTRQTKRAEP